MQPRWHFEQDEDAQWRWKHRDANSGEVQSSASFATPASCMLDAVRFTVERARAHAATSGEERFLSIALAPGAHPQPH